MAGIFCPIDNLAPAAGCGPVQPLDQCVELARAASSGWQLPTDRYHVTFLTGCAVAMGGVAVRPLRRRLVD